MVVSRPSYKKCTGNNSLYPSMGPRTESAFAALTPVTSCSAGMRFLYLGQRYRSLPCLAPSFPRLRATQRGTTLESKSAGRAVCVDYVKSQLCPATALRWILHAVRFLGSPQTRALSRDGGRSVTRHPCFFGGSVISYSFDPTERHRAVGSSVLVLVASATFSRKRPVK